LNGSGGGGSGGGGGRPRGVHGSAALVQTSQYQPPAAAAAEQHARAHALGLGILRLCRAQWALILNLLLFPLPLLLAAVNSMAAVFVIFFSFVNCCWTCLLHTYIYLYYIQIYRSAELWELLASGVFTTLVVFIFVLLFSNAGIVSVINTWGKIIVRIQVAVTHLKMSQITQTWS
jgi:hypothetical protein